MSANPESLSTVSEAILYIAGASFLLFGAFAAFVTYRFIKFFLSLIAPKPGKKVAAAAVSRPAAKSQADEPTDHAVKVANKQSELKSLIKESQKANKKGGSKEDSASHHHLFINTLKGHGDIVTGISWSHDGKHLVTACEDLYVRVFDLVDVASREPMFRRIKTARTPIGAGFSDAKGDNISVVMRGIPDTLMATYAPASGKASSEGSTVEQLWQVTGVHGKEPALAMRAVAPSPGRAGIVVSLSTKKCCRVYGTQGRELGVLEPNSLGNHDLAVSADGRFIAIASFSSEVKVWEVKCARDTGDVTSVVRVMDLKGHKKKVMSVALSHDNKRAVTASEDGTLRVWNIDVRYSMSEDPKTVLTIAMPLSGSRCYHHLALGPTGGIIAASNEGVVHLIDSKTGELVDSIDAHEGAITEMQWCRAPIKLAGYPEGVAVLATCGRDKRVRLWRCPS